MFDKIIQVLFLAIMSIGILGLPLFYYLNSRRKRIINEFENDNDSSPPDENNSNN